MGNRMTNDDKLALVAQWHNAQQKLAAIKNQEALLRQKVLSEVFNYSDAALRTDNESFLLDANYKLTAAFAITQKIVGNAEPVINYVKSIDLTLASELFKINYTLRPGVYKKLKNNMIKEAVNSILITKSSAPQLKIVNLK